MKFSLPNGEELEIWEHFDDAWKYKIYGVLYKGKHMPFHCRTKHEAQGLALADQWMAKMLAEDK